MNNSSNNHAHSVSMGGGLPAAEHSSAPAMRLPESVMKDGGEGETEINLVHLKKNADVNVLSNYLMGHIKRVRRDIFDTKVFDNSDAPPPN